MKLVSDGFYPIKEASKLTEIPERTLSRIAKKGAYKEIMLDVRKIDRRYVFSGAQLKELVEFIAKANEQLAKNLRQTKELAKKNKTGAPINVADLQKLDLDHIESFEFKFRREGQFPKEGSFVFIPSEYDYVEYLPGEYADAEEKLQEWKYQKQELIDQQKTFENLIKSQREQKEFYKEQLKYYQKLADRTLSMHEKLIETINLQTKDLFTKTVIDAKNTNWSDKNTKDGKSK